MIDQLGAGSLLNLPPGHTITAMNAPRSALASSTRALRQCRCSPSTLRPFSSTASPRSEQATNVETEQSPRPRWSYTPERLKGPGFSINVVKDPRRKIWKVNEDPKRLDAMYNRLLGRDGEKMLPEEIKWLAVTHKSFDYGRRGFNTKLAYFGRLQMSRAMVGKGAFR
jgi:large subunit ribosomal protein L15